MAWNLDPSRQEESDSRWHLNFRHLISQGDLITDDYSFNW